MSDHEDVAQAFKNFKLAEKQTEFILDLGRQLSEKRPDFQDRLGDVAAQVCDLLLRHDTDDEELKQIGVTFLILGAVIESFAALLQMEHQVPKAVTINTASMLAAHFADSAISDGPQDEGQ